MAGAGAHSKIFFEITVFMEHSDLESAVWVLKCYTALSRNCISEVSPHVKGRSWGEVAYEPVPNFHSAVRLKFIISLHKPWANRGTPWKDWTATGGACDRIYAFYKVVVGWIG